MAVSQINPERLAKYLRKEPGEYENAEMMAIINAAVSFAKSYTGLTAAEMDMLPEFEIAVLRLCADMDDNREMHIERGQINPTTQTILDMHSRNLLPKG